jgi:hypothetical protein
MMPVSNIQSAAPVTATNMTSAAGAAPADASLLPAPQELPGDPLMALLELQTKSRRLQLDSGMKDIRNNKRLKAKAYKEYKAALKKAHEARKKGGFWKKTAKLCSKLGKYGAVVAAVAIAVGTGGVGTPAALAIAGAALSSASLLQSETQFLQKMGMSDEMASYTEIGLGVGGAICTGGASGMAEADATIEAVEQGVAVTSGAANVAGGVATIKAGRYEGEARDREADALSARLEQQQLLRMFNQILDQIEGGEQSEERTMSSLRGAIQTRAATPLIVARRV